MNKSVDDLIRIANAGGGLHLDASRYSADDLIRIANVSSNKGARLHLVNTDKNSTDDLIQYSIEKRVKRLRSLHVLDY